MRNKPARNKIYTLPHSITTAGNWMLQIMFETFVINVIINFRWKKGKQPLPRNRKRSISHSLDWKWSSGWLEFWEGLLLAAGVSAACAGAIFRVKWTLKMREVLTLGWLLHWLLRRRSTTAVLLRTPVTQMIFSIKVCYSSVVLILSHTTFTLEQKFPDSWRVRNVVIICQIRFGTFVYSQSRNPI